MLKNYFKIAWRNLASSKGYSFINIGGLAAGMAIAILIGLWMYDELTYNTYHQNYNRIAQVMNKGSFGGQGFASASLQRPWKPNCETSTGGISNTLLCPAGMKAIFYPQVKLKFPRSGVSCSRMRPTCYR